MIFKKRKENREFGGICLTQSEKRIFDMSNEHLIGHFALIENKASRTLSSNERRLVQNRVLFKLRKREFTLDEINEAVLRVKKLIENNQNTTNE